MNLKVFFREAGVITATTVGAGMFGLPYVFLKSGWIAGIFYLLVLSFVVAGSHILYWRSLAVADEKRLILGMARDFLGSFWYRIGIFAVIAGLVLALVIYLILGTEFIRLFWPSVGANTGLFLFWLAGIVPLFFERRILALELTGVFFIAGIIFLIFFTAPQFAPQVSVPAIDLNNIFLPFGVVLFSLAGWTAIEPLFRERKASLSLRAPKGRGNLGSITQPTGSFAGAQDDSLGNGKGYIPRESFFAGTIVTAVLYVVFVYGVFYSTAEIAPDVVSGLTGWPFWKSVSLGVLGLFALWTSYMPIGLEIRNLLTRDLGFGKFYGLAVAIFAPPALVLLGLSNFLKVVGFAGGVFLSMQYILIVLIGKRVLKLGAAEKIFFNIVIVAFLLAAVYEFYYFVIG